VIVDTSALVAILYREPEAAAFAQLIYDADVRRISGPPFIPLNPPFGRMSGRSD
jgi:ribonuclease VapC